MKTDAIVPEFVDRAPRQLKAGVLYVSIPYDTTVHLCCCGCGTKVALPLSPAGWSVIYNGKDVSLDPSIGNGSLACRSHYWIRAGRVRWLHPMTDSQTLQARARDQRSQEAYDLRDSASAESQEPAGRPCSRVRAWFGRIRRSQ
jgi:hypothetical protein